MKLFILFGVFVLAGCSAGTNTSEESDGMTPDSANLNKFGVLAIRHGVGSVIDAHATYDGVFGVFSEVEAELSIDEIVSVYQLPLDTCITFDSPDDVLSVPASSIRDYIRESNIIGASISAGEVLTISSPSGTWLDIKKSEPPGYYYTNVSELIEPIPTQLSIFIPGDAYPEYSINLIPDVEPLAILSPGKDSVLELDNQFQWLPHNGGNTYIRITAQKLIGSNVVYLDCMATDDGKFEIPTNVQNDLGSLFKDYTVSYSRTAYYLESKADSAILVMHSVGAN